MPKVESGGATIVPAGVYTTQLNEIAVTPSTMKRDDGSDGLPFWVWKFRGFKGKDRDDMHTVEIVTGSTVSQKDGALKSLLMSAHEEMTLTEMKQYDTDEMINKFWKIKIGVTENKSGSPKNVILNIEETTDDPFADSDD